MSRSGLLAILLAIVAAGCENRQERENSDKGADAPAEPVVVYAAHADESYLPELFAEFTRLTGRRVTVRHRDADTIVDEVIANRGTPPADVLITPGVAGVWRAADEGALRPLRSDVIAAKVPANLRDPDGAWTAVSQYVATVVYSSEKIDVTALSDYASLGNDEFAGKLCLSSSALPINRALIGMLVDSEGARPAERIVRKWMANLALPPYDNEQQLLAALQVGTCAIAIVSSSAINDATGLGVFEPQPMYGNIVGVGVARHARQADAALQLIEWLIDQEASDLAGAIANRNVGVAAWRDEDAIKLAERARYR